MSESSDLAHTQILKHAESLSDGEALADQMFANLTGRRYIRPGDAAESMALIPVGAVEESEIVWLGQRILDGLGRQVEGSLIALSINTVGGVDPSVLSGAAALAQEVSRESQTPVTFFAKGYSEQDGTIGNIRRELVAAAGLALVRGKRKVPKRMTLFMGDIDLVGASTEAWRDLHNAVTPQQGFA